MQLALGFTRVVDEISRRAGIVAIYLVLFSAMISAFNALFRYSSDALLDLDRASGTQYFTGIVRLYGATSNAMTESQWYGFAGLVMLGAAWTLKVNEHVRVDVVYGVAGNTTRTWIDLLGHIVFLLPFCAVMVWFTFIWFLQAYVSGEVSNAYGGLLRWPVKLMLPLGFALLGLQGIAEIVKCILALMGLYVRDASYEKPLQ